MKISSSPRFLTRELLFLSFPIMISNLLQVLYNTVDAFYLGKIGKEAISAPSITMNISNFIIIFGAAFSVSGTTMISQAFGNDPDNRSRLDLLASQVLLVNICLSILITLIGYFSSETLMQLMKVPEGLTYSYTRSYMQITFSHHAFLFLGPLLAKCLSGDR